MYLTWYCCIVQIKKMCFLGKNVRFNLLQKNLEINFLNQQIFFLNEFEVFIHSGVEWCPKPDVAFRFSLNHTGLPWLNVDILKITKFSSHFFHHTGQKNDFLSKKILNFYLFWSGLVSLTQCCHKNFPRPYIFPVISCWNFERGYSSLFLYNCWYIYFLLGKILYHNCT